MMHDFLNKAFRGTRFSVVHACTKSVYEVHKKLCTRILNSFSPVNKHLLQDFYSSFFSKRVMRNINIQVFQEIFDIEKSFYCNYWSLWDNSIIYCIRMSHQWYLKPYFELDASFFLLFFFLLFHFKFFFSLRGCKRGKCFL